MVVDEIREGSKKGWIKLTNIFVKSRKTTPRPRKTTTKSRPKTRPPITHIPWLTKTRPSETDCCSDHRFSSESWRQLKCCGSYDIACCGTSSKHETIPRLPPIYHPEVVTPSSTYPTKGYEYTTHYTDNFHPAEFPSASRPWSPGRSPGTSIIDMYGFWAPFMTLILFMVGIMMAVWLQMYCKEKASERKIKRLLKKTQSHEHYRQNPIDDENHFNLHQTPNIGLERL